METANSTTQKEILLVTADEIKFENGYTKINFRYLFDTGAYEKFPHARKGWGYAWKADGDTQKSVNVNLFESTGMTVGGAIGQGDFDKVLIDSLPEKCNMMCTTKIADEIEKLIGDKVKLIRHHSEQPIIMK